MIFWGLYQASVGHICLGPQPQRIWPISYHNTLWRSLTQCLLVLSDDFSRSNIASMPSSLLNSIANTLVFSPENLSPERRKKILTNIGMLIKDSFNWSSQHKRGSVLLSNLFFVILFSTLFWFLLWVRHILWQNEYCYLNPLTCQITSLIFLAMSLVDG